MTLVIAVKDQDGNVYIGSDNRAWSDNYYYDDEFKLIEVGDYVVGYTCSYRTAQIIEFNKDKFPQSIQSRKDVFDFGQTLKGLMHEDGQIDKAEAGADLDHNVGLLIATKDRVYQVLGNYQFAEMEQAAVGAGQHYSLGYYNGQQDLDIETSEKVRLAIENTGKFTHTVSQQAKVINVSKSKEM